jgi:DNA-binding CsgD family transcriptional regulator
LALSASVNELNKLDDMALGRERRPPQAVLDPPRTAAQTEGIDTLETTGPIGRNAELAAVDALLEAPSAARLIVIGPPGIGKTTLVRHAVGEARRAGVLVLESCPTEAESELSHAGLGDLLAELSPGLVEALPAPQRRAIEAALLLHDRDEPARGDARALGLGLLNVLRALARTQHVLVVLDDVQWLDRPSAAALEFALRRLEGERIIVLACGREEPDWLSRERAEQIVLGPLSLGAIHRLVHERLGLSLSRPLLHRVYETAGGNPFFALELVRALPEEDTVPWEELPLPRTLLRVAEARIGALDPDTLGVLAVAASAADPTLALLRAVVGEHASERLDAAVAAGVVEVSADRARFTHPLFAAAVASRLTPYARRSIHRELARVVRNPEERARCLAVATDPPDVGVARELEAAAHLVAARGALEQAAQLAELAARFTPTADAAASRARRWTAADFYGRASVWDREQALLVELESELPPGPERAAVLWRRSTTPAEDAVRLERALDEAGGAAPLTGELHRELAHAYHFLGDLSRGRGHLRLAIQELEHADPRSLTTALGAHVLHETYAGEWVDEQLIARALELERRHEQPAQMHSPTKTVALRQLQCGYLVEARRRMEEYRQRALDYGDEASAVNGLWQLVEIACGLGRLPEAVRLGEQARGLTRQFSEPGVHLSSLLRVALAYAHVGLCDEAVALARRGEAGFAGLSFALRNTAILGFVELSRGNASAAWEVLADLPRRAAAMGYHGPAHIPAVPLAAEAAALAGETAEARRLTAELETVGRRMGNPWALAWAARVRGLIEGGEGCFDEAFAAFDDATVLHAGISAHFDEARTLLARGTVERRAKHWAEARATLELATARFDEFGAKMWAERAREELSRVAGRKRAGTKLTATEEHVAERVAAGETNKEVAAALFVSVKSVEATLTRVYAKLGVRSRAELAHRFTRAKL